MGRQVAAQRPASMPFTPDPPVPVVASLRRSFGAITWSALAGAILWPVVAVSVHGLGAIDPTPYLPWSGLVYPLSLIHI